MKNPFRLPFTAAGAGIALPFLASSPGSRKALIVTGITGPAWGLASFYLPDQASIAALVALCISLWASALVPEYWTALLFFSLATILDMAPVDVIFSGFMSSTLWLLFGGLVLGAAIRHTGLGLRAARLLSNLVGHRYTGIIASTALVGLSLAFILPSAMGRIALFLPIVASLADQLGYRQGTNGRTAMLTAAAFGTWLPAFTILPANTPNMMLAGLAESLYHHDISYWQYLMLHFPVLGALKIMVVIVLILRLFPDQAPDSSSRSDAEAQPVTLREGHLAMVLILCLGLWLTDSLHHIAPGWIALAAAVYCLWPPSGLTPSRCLIDDINYESLFFVAGIMGLGALIASQGLGSSLVQGLFDQGTFISREVPWNLFTLIATSVLVAITTNLPGVPAVMTPLGADLAQGMGLSLDTVLMTQVLAFSSVLLPYQAPPLVAAIQLGKLPLGAISRLCLLLFSISVLILIPLELCWWYLLGML